MRYLKRTLFLSAFLLLQLPCFCWGFFGHKKINYQAVFLLPPQMMVLYKPHISFLSEHAVDPDMRRYALQEEGARHYIDIDRYGVYPYAGLPRNWEEALARFGEETLKANGIVPWWVVVMKGRLTAAFREKDASRILKLSAEIGHYIADAYVPLHASSNHNGELTGQEGIHAFWESRIPELLADRQWDFFIGKAAYISSPSDFIWKRVMESGAAADTVLQVEKELSRRFPADLRYAFEERNGKLVRQHSAAYTTAYDSQLKGMAERRMREAIFAVASFWYTAWVDAGQPDLGPLQKATFSAEDLKEFASLNEAWRANTIKGRKEEE